MDVDGIFKYSLIFGAGFLLGEWVRQRKVGCPSMSIRKTHSGPDRPTDDV